MSANLHLPLVLTVRIHRITTDIRRPLIYDAWRFKSGFRKKNQKGVHFTNLRRFSIIQQGEKWEICLLCSKKAMRYIGAEVLLMRRWQVEGTVPSAIFCVDHNKILWNGCENGYMHSVSQEPRKATSQIILILTENTAVGGPSRWPRDTFCPQNLALTSLTNGGHGV
jgi:hypothetical protein